MKKIDLRTCDKILPNGMPEGYEFVRVGFAKQGELYLGSGDENCKVIVRKIEPQPLVIEAGKYYRLRNGDVVGPILRMTERYQGSLYDVCRSNGLRWKENGNYWNKSPSLKDIVAEVPCPEPPKPTYIPWTYETCPVGVAVKTKTGSMVGIITLTCSYGAMIGNHVWKWHEIFRDFTQLDGTPCGTIEP